MRRFRHDDAAVPPERSLDAVASVRDEFRSEVERQAARLLQAAEARARQMELDASTEAERTRSRAQRELEMLVEKRTALFSQMIESLDKLERDFGVALGNFRRELEGAAQRSETAPAEPGVTEQRKNETRVS